MSVQTTITAEPVIGNEGAIYDSGSHHDIVTKIAQEDIPFGRYVRIVGDQCELPDVTGEVTGRGGIAIKDSSKPSGAGYKAGDPVAVMLTGRVWVRTEQALAEGVQPFVRFAAGAGGGAPNVGMLRTDADTATAVALPGAKMFRGTGGAAGLGVLELGRTGI
ncbi:MAG: hypothetical protein K0S65_6286 [Labilithrix sp.]|nr:hypothetical protein [Labilithrix sp.]